MNRVLFQPAADGPSFGSPGYAYREEGEEAQLLEFQGRRVRVLSLKNGELQLRSYRRNGQTCHVDHRIDFEELCHRGAHPDREANGQRLLFLLDPDAPAIHRFIQLIPVEIWQRVLCYPHGMQFRMLSLFLHAGEAATRLHDCGCRGFVALVAVADWLRRQPISRAMIRQWLGRPQAEVLSQLTLPGTKRVARILRKIDTTACHYPLLRQLRCLHDARLAREVSHLPRLNVLVFDVLSHLAPGHRLVSPTCLRELAEVDVREIDAVRVSLHYHISRHRQLESLLGASLPRQTFTNLKQLRRYCDPTRDCQLPELRSTHQIPPPPFPDEGDFVRWIRTPGELLREGEAMDHCVFSCLPLLLEGRAAAAKVQAEEERATVLMVRHTDGLWHVRDMRRQCNAKPSAQLRERFANWLAVQTACAGRSRFAESAQAPPRQTPQDTPGR